ncbi:MAG: aminotransferase class IV, partial [Desulfamplus sp.]|nr:aminotransferase class IV [Desulfamplus sp.]
AHFTGFQYGAGLFETIRVQKGKVLRLKEHLERFTSSWHALFNEKLPCISWHEVIEKLICINGLEHKIVAVKLMIARGERGEGDKLMPSVDGQSDFIAAFARPYNHRLMVKYKDLSPCNGYRDYGLDLITFPERRHSPLAAHKSFNYLYYYLASLYAKKHGRDEAVICNSDGTVSETNSTSLISVMDRQVMIPLSDYVLPSVTLNATLSLFTNAGYDVVKKKIMPAELYAMQNILVLNSLMGAVRVISIDGRKIIHTDKELCGWLNRGLLIEFM